MSQNCPSWNQVAGGSSSRPPSIPSFSMAMDLIEDVADNMDILELMPLDMITIDGPESKEAEGSTDENILDAPEHGCTRVVVNDDWH